MTVKDADNLNTKDPVNSPGFAESRRIGRTEMGHLTNWGWYDDPRGLVFRSARYKFIAKMLSGSRNVLEFGCGDAFFAPIVRQAVQKLTVTDFDPVFISEARRGLDATDGVKIKWNFDAKVVDVIKDAFPGGSYDGIYSLDVLEHIPQEHEDGLMRKIVAALAPHGTVVIGMPSQESQVYASAPSKQGHINCKTEEELRTLMQRYFHNVFLFGMNDEVLHTGFGPMCHYRLALACGAKPLQGHDQGLSDQAKPA